jgi:hypothetical protein
MRRGKEKNSPMSVQNMFDGATKSRERKGIELLKRGGLF